MTIIDLTVSAEEQYVPLKRKIVFVDLTNEEEYEIMKHPNNGTSITDKLRTLSRDLIKKIFGEYLNIGLINELLQTPISILRTSVCIHQALISHRIPKCATVDKNTLSKFILTHIGLRAPVFIHFAIVNKNVISSLQVNDTFDYYEPHRNGRYIVVKTLKGRAVVQKIKYQMTKLVYKGLLINTAIKVSPKKSISFRILHERCVFSSLRNENICFINNSNTVVSVSYFIDDNNVMEKRSNMSEFYLI